MELAISMKIIFYIIAILPILAICSCRSINYIPVETVKHDSIYVSKIQHDSVYQRDSIYVLDRGDTVYVNVYQYLYKDRIVIDTVYSVKTDSIKVPFPVEKELTRWQQIKLELGGWSFCIIICLLLIISGCIVYKIIKK